MKKKSTLTNTEKVMNYAQQINNILDDLAHKLDPETYEAVFEVLKRSEYESAKRLGVIDGPNAGVVTCEQFAILEYDRNRAFIRIKELERRLDIFEEDINRKVLDDKEKGESHE